MHLPNRARAPDLSARAQCSPAPPSERRHERRSPHIWPATRPPWRRPSGGARPPGLGSGSAAQNARMRHGVRASVTLAPLFARSLPTTRMERSREEQQMCGFHGSQRVVHDYSEQGCALVGLCLSMCEVGVRAGGVWQCVIIECVFEPRKNTE